MLSEPSNHRMSEGGRRLAGGGAAAAAARVPPPPAPPPSSAPPQQERPRRPPATRTTYMPPSSLSQARPDHSVSSLIQRQLERKRNLEVELRGEKGRLGEMKSREEELRLELTARLAASDLSLKAKLLRDEIRVLTTVCSKLSDELDEESSGDEEEEQGRWCCHICTFHNHQLINQCESCAMPQGGETRNIHIHVTHHNFPSCNCYYSDYEECDCEAQQE